MSDVIVSRARCHSCGALFDAAKGFLGKRLVPGPAGDLEQLLHFCSEECALSHTPTKVPASQDLADESVPTCAHDMLVADCRAYAVREYMEAHPERRMMDVSVRCADCGCRFRFRASGGLSPDEPRASVFGDVLHVPIEPAPDLRRAMPMRGLEDDSEFGG